MQQQRLAGTVLVLAALALAVPSPARAQGYGPGMMGPGYGPGMMYGQGYGPGRGYGGGMMGYGGGMMGGCPMFGYGQDGPGTAFVDGRIAFLRAELGITEEQKAAFDAYAEAIKANVQSMQGMWQMMKAVWEAKTAPERFDAHLSAMEGRIAALKAAKPALDKLYASLSDAQKKKADGIITGMGCMM